MESITGAYEPKETESKIYEKWEKSGYFNPDNLSVEKNAKNYVVYMPLPNVTGTLHMGHALNNTIQDIVIRYHRMNGYRTLWLPGTDHAGIATQFVVEKELKKQGISRFELGREKFIEKVWEWKNKYGNTIIGQLKKLGVSCDWSRIRFTMDEAYAKDVQNAFLHYYERGLLYRGKRVVNWCPRCGTSLSELELEYKDEKSKLWYIKYDLKNQISNLKYITVATTRPETMLGDTAVAVNPKDERYKNLIGKTLMLPIVHREIPIIADDAIDMEFGTGAVKVTPAHDMVDFEIGERHTLEVIQVINERGKMNENAGVYNEMKAEEAREKIVEKLKEEGLLEKEEEYDHRVAICYRCGHVIEPIPSLQWFLKMSMKDTSGKDSLAKNALDAVKSGKVKIIPNNFEKKYFDWLENIRDWTISRQIWWGHQIPVYFCKNKLESISKSQFPMPTGRQVISNEDKERYVVSLEKPKMCPFCKNCEMEQSLDVLDTWFSSALWPFAGLSESDLRNYYPGTTLITARDILNLWVARMIYSGIEFKKELPFTNVFINGTILTKDGKRMSKSLGTGIDPLKYIDQYGADATRFGIMWQATGQDIRWDETAIIAGKKFANKLWNAARFVLTNTSPNNISIHQPNPHISASTEADKKILSALEEMKKSVEKDIEEFEFSRPLHTAYDFFWHEFCDVYLETSKEQLSVKDENLSENTKTILLHVLLSSLKIFHPFIPFVTEEIYSHIPLENKKEYLMIEVW